VLVDIDHDSMGSDTVALIVAFKEGLQSWSATSPEELISWMTPTVIVLAAEVDEDVSGLKRGSPFRS
jgi:hypothetical protein